MYKYRAAYKKISAKGHLGESGDLTFYFGTLLNISDTNRARKLKFGKLVDEYMYWGGIDRAARF